MTPADFTRLAQACERRQCHICTNATCEECELQRQVVAALRTLSSSSAEDAAGVAEAIVERLGARIANVVASQFGHAHPALYEWPERQERMPGKGWCLDVANEIVATLGLVSSAAVAEAVSVAVEREREECAKECEEIDRALMERGTAEAAAGDDTKQRNAAAGAVGAYECARRIRARSARAASGEKEGT